MTDQEKIAALAAELTRIGKMPWWIREMKTTKGVFAIHEDGTSETVLHEEAVLAALSGVAAEACADNRITIEKTVSGYRPSHYLMGCLGYLPTIHDALIAALKQVEVKP